jgi:nitrite reductase (NADH) small subunit/3-phenylpropionate/trans-cinnamate dioxygenase ferredoxin subunit
MAELVTVAKTSEIAPGQAKAVDVKGAPVAIFNVGGTYYAIEDTCSHVGGPLSEGAVDGTMVTCPWHGWQYDVKTGVSETNPSVKVKTYEVKTDGSSILISL